VTAFVILVALTREDASFRPAVQAQIGAAQGSESPA
jgi:hypothetical protein